MVKWRPAASLACKRQFWSFILIEMTQDQSKPGSQARLIMTIFIKFILLLALAYACSVVYCRQMNCNDGWRQLEWRRVPLSSHHHQSILPTVNEQKSAPNSNKRSRATCFGICHLWTACLNSFWLPFPNPLAAQSQSPASVRFCLIWLSGETRREIKSTSVTRKWQWTMRSDHKPYA